MGTFRGISPVAKYAARIGQLFSSSLRFELPVQIVPKIEEDETEELKKFKYTDGIGKISKDLMQLIRLKYGP